MFILKSDICSCAFIFKEKKQCLIANLYFIFGEKYFSGQHYFGMERHSLNGALALAIGQ